MADDIDGAQATEEIQRKAALSRVVKTIAVGEPGECHECGEHSLRLVGGRCAFCRDGR